MIFAEGNALLAIRDKRLYREQYGTFEEYCRGRWGLGRAHAYRLIEGASVIANLSPMGDILPTSERQARALTRLEPEQQREKQAAQPLGTSSWAAMRGSPRLVVICALDVGVPIALCEAEAHQHCSTPMRSGQGRI